VACLIDGGMGMGGFLYMKSLVGTVFYVWGRKKEECSTYIYF
jgi:hypothetical protein